jgi:Zn-dependent metalloprotease
VSATADWNTSRKAAVSAHVNAALVHDFYESVLHRQGIDGKGVQLRSIVNCSRPGLIHAPAWRNAQWRGDHMVYGQSRQPDGTYQSLAVHLDVIAHGVSAATVGLVYLDEAGALDESLADIFGLVVANAGIPLRDWTWTIGAGLAPGGGALRDLAKPTASGAPEHMRDYLRLNYDHGGVHVNCAIHTLAEVNLLQALLPHSTVPAFTPHEVAGLYYKTMQRLSAQATFSEARHTLSAVVATLFAGFPEEQAAKLAVVAAAYVAVGIA